MQRQRGLFKGSIKILFLYRIAFYKFGLVTPSQIVIWHPKSALWDHFRNGDAEKNEKGTHG